MDRATDSAASMPPATGTRGRTGMFRITVTAMVATVIKNPIAIDWRSSSAIPEAAALWPPFG